MQFPPLFVVHEYSHYVKLTNINTRIFEFLAEFLPRYALKRPVKENRKFILKTVHIFAARTSDRSELRMHVNQWKEFKEFLERKCIPSHLYKHLVVMHHKAVSVVLKIRDNWILRDYQEEACGFITDGATPMKVVEIQTGRGKGIISMSAAAQIGLRVCVLIKSRYMIKWVNELLEVYDIKPTDIMTVTGADQLKGIVDLADNGALKAKIIVMSISTHRNFLNLYEKDHRGMLEVGYDFTPEDLFARLGVGNLIVDEVHQEFFAQYKAMLYTHLKYSTYLSATLLNNDPFMESMYRLVFPPNTRFDGLEYLRYIRVLSVSYHLSDPNKIRTTEAGVSMYSHHAFEGSLLRNKHLLQNYTEMVEFFIKTRYLDRKAPGDKCILFFSSIAMCTHMTEYFSRKFRDLKVRRYVEDDEFDNCINSDITFSTILSSGTAIDIPGLITVINTINILSWQANLQAAGRLRHKPGKEMVFVMLYSLDIDKHKEYNASRKELFANRTESIKDLHYHRPV